MSEHWSQCSYTVAKHTTVGERIGDCISELTNVSQLLSEKDLEIQAWSPNGSHSCDASAAKNLFEHGVALYVRGIDKLFSSLTPLLRELEDDLSVPPKSAHCSLFISPAGAVIPQHFDHDYGFNLLLRGSKRWRLGSNTWIKYPLAGYQWGRQSDLHESLGPPPSTDDLSSACEIGLVSGECIFVPRGVWHSTVADEESVSLDFAVDPPCRLGYILEHLSDALLGDPAFRQSVDSSWNEWVASVKNDLPSRVRELLMGLSHSGMSSEDVILSATDAVRFKDTKNDSPMPVIVTFLSNGLPVRSISVTRNIAFQLRYSLRASNGDGGASELYDLVIGAFSTNHNVTCGLNRSSSVAQGGGGAVQL